MTYVAVDVVEVWAWDARVGAVAYDDVNRVYVFEFDRGWIRSGRQPAPLQIDAPLRQPSTSPSSSLRAVARSLVPSTTTTRPRLR